MFPFTISTWKDQYQHNNGAKQTKVGYFGKMLNLIKLILSFFILILSFFIHIFDKILDSMNLILNFGILTILSMILASEFVKITGLQFWWGAIFLIILALLLYFVSIFLTVHIINKKAPGILELYAAFGKPMKDGEYLWEKTAGTGLVPKWVSMIGIASYACIAGTIIWIITWLGYF